MADEKIFTIPLGEAYKKAEKKRTPYAARLVRSFLTTHTKAKTIKLGDELNKTIWSRGIRHPPRRVRVKIVTEGDVVKAELVGFDYKDFKVMPKSEKKGAKEKLMERLGPKAAKKEEEEKVVEGKETREEAKEKVEEVTEKTEEKIKEQVETAGSEKKE